jgi:arginine/ornithine transport system permease protein
MDFTYVIQNLPLYFKGLWVTVQLVGMALAFGPILAIPLGILRASRNPLFNVLPWAYIYFFRGTPLLVQAFLIYYGMAQFEAVRTSFLWPVLREAYWCALIAFTLNTAAYTAEIIRGAIVQTPWGEVEAGRACGMSPLTLYRRIVLPGAFRRALPAYGNEVIFMLHGSAIAGVITIVDLFGAARIVNARYFVPFEAFLMAGLFYLTLTFGIVYLFRLWERRWHAHLHPRDAKAEGGTAPVTQIPVR